jgi:hypothetical protein
VWTWLTQRGWKVLLTGTFWWAVLLVVWFLYLYLTSDPKPTLSDDGLHWPGRYWAFWLAAVLLSIVTFGLHFFSLRGADEATKASPRRGLFYLVVGADGRVSTSKLQVILWTYAIAFVFVGVILRGDASAIPTDIEPQYLFLLGIPVIGAAGASLITSQKLEGGQIAKVPVEETGETSNDAPGPLAGLGQVVSDDQGRGDVGDFQYFIFNVVGLVYFFVELLATPNSTLPVLPDTLVALTGASALAYLTKKGVISDTPLLNSITPTRVAPGEEIQLSGQHFSMTPSSAAAQDEGPTVLIDGRPATVVAAGPAFIRAKVPSDTAEGTVKVRVHSASGLETEDRELTVQTPVPLVLSFYSNVLTKGEAATITFHGRGFHGGASTGSPTVSLGGLELSVGSNSTDTRLTASVSATQSQGLDAGEAELVVRNRAGSPSAVTNRIIVKDP